MNSKKSIVLLITLFFISAISILILQNLKDTDKLLDNITAETSFVQIQITIDNINSQIPAYFKKHKDKIDKFLENSEAIPLSFGNVSLLFNIQEYIVPQFNINNLTNKMIDSKDFSTNIHNQYDFIQIVNKHKKHTSYTNNNQIQQTIKEYIKLTKDKDILNIANNFSFLEYKKEDRLIECNYTLIVEKTTCEVTLIFDLNLATIKSFNLVNIF